jgi:uncharacterized protein with von Willebrand factor type A (vWA) domain
MLTDFFLKLKAAKVPVSIKEWLTLMDGMQSGVIGPGGGGGKRGTRPRRAG